MTHEDTSLRGLHRLRQRGVASVEALIVIGFLLIIWASVLYVARSHEARQLARLTARECAWKIAVSGCREVPPQCRGAAVGRAPGDDRLEENFVPVEDAVQGTPRDEDGVTEGARELVGAQVEGLLFERITAHASRTVRQPATYGGGTLDVAATYSLPCNSTPTSVGDQARSFFDAIVRRRM